jgi:hypothetical protein
MPWNPAIDRYSDDVKVCIGFYLDSYSLGGIKSTAGLGRGGGGYGSKPLFSRVNY